MASCYVNIHILVMHYSVPYLIFVESVELQFSQSSFAVFEGDGPIQPVLELSRALDCCNISVRVDIQTITASGR